jgi:hypothetical protein
MINKLSTFHKILCNAGGKTDLKLAAKFDQDPFTGGLTEEMLATIEMHAKDCVVEEAASYWAYIDLDKPEIKGFRTWCSAWPQFRPLVWTTCGCITAKL